MTTTTSRPVSMIFLNSTFNPVVAARNSVVSGHALYVRRH